MEGFTLESLLLEVLDKLDPKQFSFPKKSTTQALVYLMHQIHAGLEKGQCPARVFFADFKKRFDLVDHNDIFTDFERLGVNPIIIRWIKSFLADREHCVRVGNCKSSWKKTNTGLPQGTKSRTLTICNYS
jgi:hypothetical protein